MVGNAKVLLCDEKGHGGRNVLGILRRQKGIPDKRRK